MYLKPSVAVEPLFNQWYAWWYLLAPATAPMLVANLHLKLMQSFATAPEVHVSALQNPELRGGPFINYPANRAAEIRALLEKTAAEQADLVAFARAIAELEKLLAASGNGNTLEGLYDKVPDILRGYVELVYDLRNQASFRFIEALLYRSKYFRESAQSVALRPLLGDERPYVFSIPRLDDGDVLHLRVPFKSDALDRN